MLALEQSAESGLLAPGEGGRPTATTPLSMGLVVLTSITTPESTMRRASFLIQAIMIIKIYRLV